MRIILNFAIVFLLAGCNFSANFSDDYHPGFTLVSIQVIPSSAAIALASDQAFRAIAQFSDGSTQDYTNLVTWESADTSIGAVSGTGIANTKSAGVTTIKAQFGNLAATATLDVQPAHLVSISITPVSPTIALGNTQQAMATGTYSDASTQDLTASVTWSSVNGTGAASVNSSGLISTIGGAQGSVTVTATSGTISGSTIITVAAATLVNIALTPANPSLALGLTQQFTATGTYSDSSTANITASVIWSRTNGTGAASINGSGLASTVGGTAGTVTITAIKSGISGSTTLTVTAATLTSIALTPTNPSVVLGSTQQFTATGTYSDSSTQNVTNSVTWSETDGTGSAGINASGLLSTASGSAGTVTVTAATAGVTTQNITVTITAPTLVSIAVTPANLNLLLGNTAQLTATGTYSDSSTQNLTSSVTWSETNGTGTATVNASGLVSAVGGTAGTVTVTATIGAINGNAGELVVAYGINTVAGDYWSNIGVGNAATTAMVLAPEGAALDASGNLYIADYELQVIRKIDVATGTITNYVGNGQTGYSGDSGPATAATINGPTAIAFNPNGDLYFGDSLNHVVRKVTAATGIITTVAGTGVSGNTGNNGLATAATLGTPSGLWVDSSSDILISDSSNNVIRSVQASNGNILAVAGTGTAGYCNNGLFSNGCKLNGPTGLAVDSSGIIYFADTSNYIVRKIDAMGAVHTVAGTNGVYGYSGDGGAATAATLKVPTYLSLDSANNLYITDAAGAVRMVQASSGNIYTVAGNGTSGFSGDGGLATAAELGSPSGIAIDASNNFYVADGAEHNVRRVDGTTNLITTFAGNRTEGYSGDGAAATLAEINNPSGVVTDSSGNIYVSDTKNGRVRKLNISTGEISTFAGTGTSGYAGDGGPATAALLSSPMGLAIDASGNIYIADSTNNVIREVRQATGDIYTVAGNGSFGYGGDGGPATSANLAFPYGVGVDSNGNIFIADTANSAIREVTISNGNINTVAGIGGAGSSGDGGPATSAFLHAPRAVALDASGNFYIADTANSKIRKVTIATGIIKSVAGTGIAGYSGDGGAATSAKLRSPCGVILDASGNIYISDSYNNAIREVSAATGTISTLAGNGSVGYFGDGGPAASALFNNPAGIFIDANSNIFIADTLNNVIRELTP